MVSLAENVQITKGSQRALVLERLHTIWSGRFRAARRIKNPRRRAERRQELLQEWSQLSGQPMRPQRQLGEIA